MVAGACNLGKRGNTVVMYGCIVTILQLIEPALLNGVVSVMCYPYVVGAVHQAGLRIKDGLLRCLEQTTRYSLCCTCATQSIAMSNAGRL